MRSFIAAVATTSLLGGCGLHQQIDASRCESYGLKPGTAAFAGCMERRDELRRSAGLAMMAVGAGMIASQPSYSAPQPPAEPTRMLCQRNPFGQSGVTCTEQ